MCPGWRSSSALALLLATALAGAGCTARGADSSAGPTGAPAAPPPRVPRFVEAAAPTGLSFRYDHGGSGRFYYVELVGGGGALLDYDGDGWLDLYCTQAAPLPGRTAPGDFRNRLYRNLGGDGRGLRFQDVTASVPGAAALRDGRPLYALGVAAADYDGDGFTDLFVTGFRGAALLRNESGRAFRDVTRAAGLADTDCGASATFLDYDRDGVLDLAVCEYVVLNLDEHQACQDPEGHADYCQPDYYRPARQRLYRGLGNGRFQDVTAAAGLTQPGRALGVVAGDVNGDGWPDLYFACDKTPGLLYINNGRGGFTEEALTRGCALSLVGQPQSGMGVDLQDVDGDLLPDLLVTNYWFEGNNLYRNQGGGDFRDEAAARGILVPNREQVSFGVGLADLNASGWLDLLITNGHVLTRTKSATPGAERAQRDQLYLNLGGGQFREVSTEAGTALARRHVGRGSAFGDVDNDGDVDVVRFTNEGPLSLLLNETPEGMWLQLRLEGTGGNRQALGAVVDITAGGRTQRRTVRTGYSYCAASEALLTVGLGRAARADRVEVHWPEGTVERFGPLEARRRYRLARGGETTPEPLPPAGPGRP